MSDQIIDLLSEVHAQQREYELVIEPPASPKQITTLREIVRAELGVDAEQA